MSDWAPKRFWTKAQVAPAPDGFTVTLDGRSVKTPAKTPLVVPTEALAEQIAAEWQAQKDKIDPRTMPFTRTANSALDKVAVQHAEVAQMLADYGDSDLLCYRAEMPAELANRQADLWDPVLDWAAQTLGARLQPRVGIMHRPQDPQSLEALKTRVFRQTPFELAAFHDLVSMTGSLVLAFAAVHGHQPPDAIWDLSRVDELWQQEQWGVDEEAEILTQSKRGEFLHAHRFYGLCAS